MILCSLHRHHNSRFQGKESKPQVIHYQVTKHLCTFLFVAFFFASFFMSIGLIIIDTGEFYSLI